MLNIMEITCRIWWQFSE